MYWTIAWYWFLIMAGINVSVFLFELYVWYKDYTTGGRMNFGQAVAYALGTLFRLPVEEFDGEYVDGEAWWAIHGGGIFAMLGILGALCWPITILAISVYFIFNPRKLKHMRDLHMLNKEKENK